MFTPNSRPQHRLLAALLLSLMGAGALSGCAVPATAILAAPEEGIDVALLAQDHEAIASAHERQAAADAASAKRHSGFAAIYRRNRSPAGREAHEPLARHCEELARTYQLASSQKLSTARLHRELARQAGQP
jgi:hypothetical protein